jgi:hypothetical protein
MKKLHDWRVCYRASRIFAWIDLENRLRRDRRSRARMHFEDEMMRNRDSTFAGTSGFRSTSVQIPREDTDCTFREWGLFEFVLDTTRCDAPFLIFPKLFNLHSFATRLIVVLPTQLVGCWLSFLQVALSAVRYVCVNIKLHRRYMYQHRNPMFNAAISIEGWGWGYVFGSIFQSSRREMCYLHWKFGNRFLVFRIKALCLVGAQTLWSDALIDSQRRSA